MISDVDVGWIWVMILSRNGLLYRCSGDAIYLSTDVFKRKYGKLLDVEDGSNVSEMSRAYNYLVLSQESRIYFYYVGKF